MNKKDNFNILFEKIGHIEASQNNTYRLLERIEAHGTSFEKRLQKVERQTTRLVTISSLCACLITITLGLLT